MFEKTLNKLRVKACSVSFIHGLNLVFKPKLQAWLLVY